MIKDASVGRTSWEGGKRKPRQSRPSETERAPALSPYKILAGPSESQRGRARANAARRPTFRLPPSQLVRPTEMSFPTSQLVHPLKRPFHPAC